MTLRKAVLLSCLAGIVSACSLLGGPRSLPPLPLLPPADLGYRLQLSQRVEVIVDGESRTFLAAWRATPERLDFVGLTPTGQRLLTLAYDGEQFTEDYSELLPEPIPGRDVLTQLQLAHWPLASIKRNLAGTDWRMEAVAAERRLYFRDHLIFTIAATYPDGASYPDSDYSRPPASIHIESRVAPFELMVETLGDTSNGHRNSD